MRGAALPTGVVVLPTAPEAKVVLEDAANEAGLIAAPLADHAEPPVEGPLAKNYGVTSSKSGTVTAGEETAAVEVPVYDVVIRAEEVKAHTNDAGEQSKEAFWVGIGIPVSTEEGVSYRYYAFTVAPGNEGYKNKDYDWTAVESWTHVATADERTYETGGKTYNTIYFEIGGESADLGLNDTVVAVEKVTEGAAAQGAGPNPENVLKYLYVTFQGSTLEEDVEVNSFPKVGDDEVKGDIKTQYSANSIEETTTVNQTLEDEDGKVEYKGTLTETFDKVDSENNFTSTANTTQTFTYEGTDEETGEAFKAVQTFELNGKATQDGAKDTYTATDKLNNEEIYKSVGTITTDAQGQSTGKMTTTIKNEDGSTTSIVTNHTGTAPDPENITSQTVNNQPVEAGNYVDPYDGPSDSVE